MFFLKFLESIVIVFLVILFFLSSLVVVIIGLELSSQLLVNNYCYASSFNFILAFR